MNYGLEEMCAECRSQGNCDCDDCWIGALKEATETFDDRKE